MRDLLTVTATVCAVSGLVLAAGSTLFEQGTSWLHGFVTGCCVASGVIALAVGVVVGLGL